MSATLELTEQQFGELVEKLAGSDVLAEAVAAHLTNRTGVATAPAYVGLTPQQRRARLGRARVPLPPDALKRLRAAGGAAWDKVEDPAAYLNGERA